MEDKTLKQVTETLQRLLTDTQHCKHKKTCLTAEDVRVFVYAVQMLALHLGIALSASRTVRIRRATLDAEAYRSGKYRGPCTQLEFRNDEFKVHRLQADQSYGHRFRPGFTFEIEVDSWLIRNGVADGMYRLLLIATEPGQAVPWKELGFWIVWKGTKADHLENRT